MMQIHSALRRCHAQPLQTMALTIGIALVSGQACTPSQGSADSPDLNVSSAAVETSLHDPWASVLATYMDDAGLVDYAGLQTEGRDELQLFIDSIADFDVGSLETDAEKIAFWINAYNAMTVWQVVERYPLESVRDVGALFGLVGGFFKQEMRIAGEDRSLDDIEHGILRAEYPDARIHWTLVCAAFGCPRLVNRPYLPSDLDSVLTAQAYEFLAQPRALQIDHESEAVYLSRYFDWYAGDFEAETDTVIDYVLQYAPEDAATWIRDHRDSLQIRFVDYDWTLNDQAKGPRRPPTI